MISGVSKVIVPVEDQERAKQFWTERVGFYAVRDESYGDERWIEVSPGDGGPLLVLSPRPVGDQRREVPDSLPHSPVFFNCADIHATHRGLLERGVEFALPPQKQHFGWWSLFVDHDGVRYQLADDGAIAVNSDRTISVAWWLRNNNGDWAPWMHNTFTRIR